MFFRSYQPRSQLSLLPSILIAAAIALIGSTSSIAALSDPDNPTNPIIDTETPVIIPVPAAPPPFTSSDPVKALDLATDIVAAGVTIEDKALATDTAVSTTISPTGTVGPLLPGRHVISWTATDTANNSVTEIQNIDVLPKVNFAIDQTDAEGNSAVTVSAHLNGFAPIYPVTIPFTVGGTSDGTDHNAVASNIVITSGNLSGSYSFNLIDDSPTADSGESVVFTFGALEADRVDLGTKNTLTVTISETNLAPTVGIKAQQPLLTYTRAVVAGDGEVTLAAETYDPNGDAITYDWSATDNSLVPTSGTTDSTFTFDPLGLSDGYYTARLTVSDGTASTSTDLLLKVFATAPTLSTTADSDGDSIVDSVDGITDDDQDGIPNFGDAIANPAWLQAWYATIFNPDYVTSGSKTSGAITLDWSISTPASNLIYYPMLLEAEPGLNLRLGKASFIAGGANARIKTSTAESLLGVDIPDTITSIDGQVIDIEITGLKNTGQSVKLVMPQSAPIPPSNSGNPEFYIYSATKTWDKFSDAGSNAITTADISSGYCPEPGNVAYTSALSGAEVAANKDCVEILIEDGGPNDGDGQANGVIRLMGGIFVAASAGSSSSSSSSSSQSFSGSIDTTVESLNRNASVSGGGGRLGIWSFYSLLILTLWHRKQKPSIKP